MMLMKLKREESDKAFLKLSRRGCKVSLLGMWIPITWEMWISFLLSAHRGCVSLGFFLYSDSPSQAQDMNL